MSSNRRTSCLVRQWQWSAKLGLAAAAVAVIGMGTARADTIDELLIQSEGDMTQTGTLYGGIDPSLLDPYQAANQAGEVASLQNQADLISQIQTQQDALPETLQSSSQLLTADQQLVTASGDLVSAMHTFVNAADAGDFATGQTPTLIGDLTGFFAKLDVAYAELFQLLPAELNAEFTTVFDGFPNTVEPITVPTDLATGADSAATVTDSNPADLLSDASTTLTDGNQALESINVSGLDEQLAGTITAQLGLDNHAIVDIGNLAAAENVISANDGSFSTVVNDLLTPIDQNIYQSTEAILAAEQAFDVALSADTGGVDPAVLVADLGLLAPDYQLLGEIVNAVPIDWFAQLF
jgi:hypothetical protein